MPPASSQHLVIEALREQIRRLERRPARRRGFLGSGRCEVDALLPGGGFPRGALADLSGGPASGKTLLALSVLAEAQREGLASFVDGRGEFYPPAAPVLGLDLARLLVVRMGGPQAPPPAPAGMMLGGPAAPPGPPLASYKRAVELLWAAEALLASGAFAAVAIDVPMAEMPVARAEAMLRRLQAAAEKGGAVGLWLGVSGLVYRVPAALRLEIEPSDGAAPARVRRVRAREMEEAGSARRRAEAKPQQTMEEAGFARRRAEAKPQQAMEEAGFARRRAEAKPQHTMERGSAWAPSRGGGRAA